MAQVFNLREDIFPSRGRADRKRHGVIDDALDGIDLPAGGRYHVEQVCGVDLAVVVCQELVFVLGGISRNEVDFFLELLVAGEIEQCPGHVLSERGIFQVAGKYQGQDIPQSFADALPGAFQNELHVCRSQHAIEDLSASLSTSAVCRHAPSLVQASRRYSALGSNKQVSCQLPAGPDGKTNCSDFRPLRPGRSPSPWRPEGPSGSG